MRFQFRFIGLTIEHSDNTSAPATGDPDSSIQPDLRRSLDRAPSLAARDFLIIQKGLLEREFHNRYYAAKAGVAAKLKCPDSAK
jgi:hypothetical protein